MAVSCESLHLHAGFGPWCLLRLLMVYRTNNVVSYQREGRRQRVGGTSKHRQGAYPVTSLTASVG